MGIMEKKRETTIVYWGNIGIYSNYVGIVEKKMEATIVGISYLYRDYIPVFPTRKPEAQGSGCNDTGWGC